ncbi:MAG: sigma-70 family RNA polymerase sigma factor [Phycisphaerales bacterium]
MLNSLTTSFISRLRANDQAAWFELWETFGPVIRAQLTKWGRGRIGVETVRDLSQETLTALSNSIDRYDPGRGARFSTWLLAIAKHVLGDEMDRRMALKRGGGKSKASFDDSWMVADASKGVDKAYEDAVFRAKVEAAIRMVERDTEFTDFSIYRMRVLDGIAGKDVAVSLGVSEPTVSRRLTKVRDALRVRLQEVISTYSFTDDELAEGDRNGLMLNPNTPGGGAPPERKADKDSDSLFDEAIAEIYHRQMELRRIDEQALAD